MQKEQIQAMEDVAVVKLFRDFSLHILQKSTFTLVDIYGNTAEEIKSLLLIQQISQSTPEDFLQPLVETESPIIARQILLSWSEHEDLAPILAQFLEEYVDQELAAGTILALGGVVSMILLTTSLKIEKKGKEWNMSLDSSNISDNSVRMVQAFLGSIPNSLLKFSKVDQALLEPKEKPLAIENSEELIDEIRALLKENEIDQVLQLMEETAKKTSKKFHDEVVLLQNRWNRLIERDRSGFSPDAYEWNIMIKDILQCASNFIEKN